MLKKEIKHNIKVLEKKLLDINTSKDLRVLRAKKEYEDVYSRIDKELGIQRDFIKEDLIKLKNLLKPRKRAVKETPAELQEWLKQYSSGLTGGNSWVIIWYSNDLKYVIVRVPGGSYTSGREQHYGNAESRLMEREGNIDFWHGKGYMLEIEGRLTKEGFQNMLDLIPEESKEGVKVR